MKNLMILLGFLTTFFCNAQPYNALLKLDKQLQVTKLPVSLKSVDSNFTLEGKEFKFNGQVFKIKIAPSLNLFFVFTNFYATEEYKEVFAYNIKKDSVLWGYKTLCQDLKIFGDKAFLSYFEPDNKNNKIFIIDYLTGTPRLVLTNANVFYISKMNLIMNSPYQKKSKNIELMDLKTLRSIYKTDTAGNYFLSFCFTSDSFNYININGILAFDNNFNKIWSANLNCMQKDTISAIKSIFSGSLYNYENEKLPTYYPYNYSVMLCSRFLPYHDNLIITDKDHIYAFNKLSGEKAWEQNLPFKTGFSVLFRDNDSLVNMLNSGLSIRNGIFDKHITPYYLVFNPDNGSIITSILFEKDESLVGNKLKGDSLFVLLNDRLNLFKYGSILKDKKIDLTNAEGSLTGFYEKDSSKYFIKDSTSRYKFKPVAMSGNPGDIILVSNKGLLFLDETLNIYRFIRLNDIFKLLYESDNIQYFESLNFNKTWFYLGKPKYKIFRYDKAKDQISEFELRDPYYFEKDSLFIVKSNSIDIINLK